MKARDNLRELYPKCWLYNNGYWFGRVTYTVYSASDNKNVLGTGNTPKNAYSNALSNCIK